MLNVNCKTGRWSYASSLETILVDCGNPPRIIRCGTRPHRSLPIGHVPGTMSRLCILTPSLRSIYSCRSIALASLSVISCASRLLAAELQSFRFKCRWCCQMHRRTPAGLQDLRWSEVFDALLRVAGEHVPTQIFLRMNVTAWWSAAPRLQKCRLLTSWRWQTLTLRHMNQDITPFGECPSWTNPYCGAAVQPAESPYIGPNTHYRPASLGQRDTPRLVGKPE